MTPLFLYSFLLLQTACFRSDITAICCQSACSAKVKYGYHRANTVLESCSKSIGCAGAWSVNMMCQCWKGK